MAVKHSKKTKRRLIEAYKLAGSVKGAAAIVGIHRDLHYDWMAADPEYRKAFEEASEPVGDTILAEVVSRSITGWLEPVFSGGKRALDFMVDEKGNLVLDEKGKPKAIPASVLKKSDACLLALAAARVPGFSQKATQRGGGDVADGSGSVELTVVDQRDPIPETE